jgi:hypothetical protein
MIPRAMAVLAAHFKDWYLAGQPEPDFPDRTRS